MMFDKRIPREVNTLFDLSEVSLARQQEGRRRTSILGILLVLSFLLLAWHSEDQARDLERAVQKAEQLAEGICEQRNQNVQRDNMTYAKLAQIERDNPFGIQNPSITERRIAVYENAMLATPVCDPEELTR